MSDNEITVIDETEGAGKANVDTKSLIGVDSKTVHRQVINIGDPSTFARVAEVNANNELKVKHTDSVAITNTNLDAALSTLATQATLALIKAKTDNLDATTSSRATEATLAIISGNIADIEALLDARLNTLGQKTMASSMPVALASDQSSIPVSLSEPISVDDNGGSLTVDGTVTANVSDNATRDNGKIDIAGFDVGLPAGTNNIGDVDIVSLPNEGQQTMANSISVAVASDQTNVPVSQATASNLNAQIVGNSADAATDAGNPVKIGIIGRTTNRTPVSDGQRVNAIGDDLGRQVVVLNQVRDLVTDATTTVSNTTETTILAAAASTFHDVVLITAANTSATAVRVDFRDTTGGSVRFSLYIPAGATVGFAPPVPVKQTTVNTNWTAQLSAAVTDVRIFIQAVKNV
jgi:hypothetical protein